MLVWSQKKESPLSKAQGDNAVDDSKKGSGKNALEQGNNTSLSASVIERSPESARIVLIGSNSFASDLALTLASEGMGTLYNKPLEFMQNMIDVSLEDAGLLRIRGRTQFSRTLLPMSPNTQATWEYGIFVAAIFLLLMGWLWRGQAQRSALKRFESALNRSQALRSGE